MMEEEITNLISNVGFPIAAFVMMWYSNNKTLKKLTEVVEGLKELIISNIK